MKNENMGNTIKTVRTLGVIALLLSGVIFLVQGYMDWDGFQRFLAFSGVNLLIGGFGVFCAQVWREPKGARTMLALAGAGVSAQFAQLGGMVFTTWQKFQLQAQSLSQTDLASLMKTEVPEIFSGLDVQPLQLVIASGLLLVLGIPILSLAMKVLNRTEHKSYRNLFLVNALFLLIPFREVWMVVPQLALAGILLYRMVKRGEIQTQITQTFEKWLSLLIGLSPVMIGLARSFFYVDSAVVLLGLMSLGMTLACAIYAAFSAPKSRPENLDFVVPRKRHRYSATLMWALATFSLFAYEICHPFILSDFLKTFIIMAPALIAVGEFDRRDWISDQAGGMLAAFMVGGFAYAQLLDFTLQNGLLLALLAGIGMVYGFINRNRVAFGVACLALVVAMVETALQGLSFKMIFSWINLAGMGIVTILLASLMEKKSLQIKDFQKQLSQRFSGQS